MPSMLIGRPSPATELVLAAQNGDRQAVDRLIAGEVAHVYRRVGRALRWHADVDDVVQETLLQIVRCLPSVREIDRFRPWVCAVTDRQVQRHLRDLRRRQHRQETLTVDQPDPAGDFTDRADTEELLERQRREITVAARWLDDDDRHLLALWWRETAGRTTRAETAAALGVGAGLAAVRVNRMRTRLASARTMTRALDAGGCDQLTGLTRSWDGRPCAIWRKRLTRHTRGCLRCTPTGD
ncbi:RNA polymerase sigma factor [Actinoplanes couchii]|uniref:RNA polymerase sigma-70 region 2 domain-containing protein n=1 Tax=Actinoplanes couchii TaxID=403638 RepID=A0ABQ3XHX4_9ACTN|nr:sigma-70 family RNA polymerase sigma factor [Actinoplanes couchii]MDR6317700.1 RNA polymerase sigma factor (sigma-70 family) [Actinoplanes couchii]GID58085.1 hypothetical protein Aco03nite_064890 [Actinoplanes couchii]